MADPGDEHGTIQCIEPTPCLLVVLFKCPPPQFEAKAIITCCTLPEEVSLVLASRKDLGQWEMV